MTKGFSNRSFAITGATVVDISNGSKNMFDILIEGERIKNIVPQGQLNISAKTHTVDATGQYVIPGLWDAHVHMTAWPEMRDQLAVLYIANGITSVRDMGGRLEDILSFRARASEEDAVAPRMWIAGPIVDGAPRITDGGDHGPDMAVEVCTPEEAVALVDDLVAQGVNFIKPYEMLLPEVFKALVQRAQHYHHLPACGHLPIRMTIPEVLEVGQYDIQHLGGICAGIKYDCSINSKRLAADRRAVLDGCAHGESGVDLLIKILNSTEVTPEEQDTDRIADLIQLFVEKGTWHTPTLIIVAGHRELKLTNDPFVTDTLRYLPESRRKKVIEAQNSTADPIKLDQWRRWNFEVVGQMHAAGVKFLAGTDCPAFPDYTPAFCLHLELQAMVLAGLSPLEALQTATINPAQFFNITDDFGSIETGKFADLVLLERDPLLDIKNCRCISGVFSRGKFYDRQVLSELLENVSAY